MARRQALLLSALVLAPFAQTASAQEGSGLYEPFPGPVTEERGVTFVQTMVAASGSDSRETPIDAAALREGIALEPSFEAPAPAGPSERAASSSGLGGSLGLIASIALVLALALALPALRLQRTRAVR